MSTITDVARRAGVSIKTVSRVINEEPYVRAKTRARVVDAMAALAYVANVSARRLASGRANAVGFVYDNPSWHYISTALQGVVARARSAGFDTVIHPCRLGDAADCQGILELVTRRSVDGFVFTPPCDLADGVLGELQAAGVPYVRITPRERGGPQPYVTAGDRQGACDMTRYLIALGHRRIGFIMGSPLQVASQERLDGYRAALASCAVDFDPALVCQGDFGFASGRTAARELLAAAARPTAVFASNDDMAAGVLAAAHDLRLAVPEQVSVAGFDNTPLSWQVWPALTTVEQPIRELAVLATEILLRRLAGDSLGVEHHCLPTQLVIRASTGPAPA